MRHNYTINNIIMSDIVSIYNSLTATIVPVKKTDAALKWYTCGPTIYDSAHIGHARTFISFDIMRRVFEYFGYKINYVMNLTDIDDKIINKVNSIMTPGTDFETAYYDFVAEMEQEFWSDMDALGVRRPDVVTRVTDYIDKIILYIQQIIDNGLAYEMHSSVYFDSGEFKRRQVHSDNNCALVHNCAGDSASESASEFSNSIFNEEKKSSKDFVLWKATKNEELKARMCNACRVCSNTTAGMGTHAHICTAKSQELSFDSPWGKGRPGWHIECSTMSHDILGENIDIHGGGIDLAFPHHQNEIYQSIAHKNANDDYVPVTNFVHCGHLQINSIKMAKSGGNSRRIKDCLMNYSARELRLMVLMHQWNAPMNYSQDMLDQMRALDEKIRIFYNNMTSIRARASASTSASASTDAGTFAPFFETTKSEIISALKNNINTRSVINLILDLIHEIYVRERTGERAGEATITAAELNISFEFIDEILQMCGLDYSLVPSQAQSEPSIKFIVDIRNEIRSIISARAKQNDAIAAELSIIMEKWQLCCDDAKIVEINDNFRQRVELVMGAKLNLRGEIFGILDELRDKIFPAHGIILEDISNTESKFYFSNR